jgi:D-alanyl-D-alanine carboxypeptidase/D-alanyl-D-alanine-endopeptidase (penicillin-binding protein 4)
MFSNQVITVAPGLSAHLEYYRPAEGNLVYLRGQLPAKGVETIDVTVPRPAEWFANGLKLALARRGISVAGSARGVMWPEAGPKVTGGGVKLGTIYSAPVREMVRDLLKNSQNLETDLLLEHAGELTRATNAPPWQTSEQAGVRELMRFLDQAGVAPGAVSFDEGSGLSRNNLTTAEATVALLQFMARHRERTAFLAALPVAGVDGTLSRRFRGTAAAGILRAKTGTLHWAQALSGYVTTAAGEHLAFSFMLNRFAATAGRSGQDEIDSLAVLLAGLAGRSDAAR